MTKVASPPLRKVHGADDRVYMLPKCKLASPITGPCMPVSEGNKWVEDMLVTIAKLEKKYGAKYKPIGEGGVIFSAQVAIPRIDFSKVKPHLHRNLPKPTLCPVNGCSEDSTLYTRLLVAHPDSGLSRFPFGYLPGFQTNLGIVPVPQDPIGGFVYKDGTGDGTTWQLYAENVFI